MYIRKVLLKIPTFNGYLVLFVTCTVLLVFYNYDNKFEFYKSEIQFPIGGTKDINDLHIEIVKAYLSRRQVSTQFFKLTRTVSKVNIEPRSHLIFKYFN